MTKIVFFFFFVINKKQKEYKRRVTKVATFLESKFDMTRIDS